MQTRLLHSLCCALLSLALLAGLLPASARAQEGGPAAQAEQVRTLLLQAQMALAHDPAEAAALQTEAHALYTATLAAPIAAAAPESGQALHDAFARSQAAVAAGDGPALAAARALIWTGLLQGAREAVLAAVAQGDATAARSWLLLREFRHATRYSRPEADATLALSQLDGSRAAAQNARQAVDAELLGAYQARLHEALADLRSADAQEHVLRRAELAGLAAGYFAILAPAYAEQGGAAALRAAQEPFDALLATAAAGKPVAAQVDAAAAVLDGFQAAPLSPAQQQRRASQMLRFLKLVPVEYGRGVRNGEVAVDLELREAVTFGEGAQAAFVDLYPDLAGLHGSAAAQAREQFTALNGQLAAAAQHERVAAPAAIDAQVAELDAQLRQLLPATWQKQDSNADFDAIQTALDQLERAVAEQQYDLAASAQLDAYAILESGPEARLIAFAPQYIAPLEELFWYGQGEAKGLAYLIDHRAPLPEMQASRAALDATLAAAQDALGGESAPAAILLNASIIVFREGLEAVVILAALLASMVGARRIYRRPVALGVLVAFVASGLTWWLMQTILASFRAYGERLEAVVSLVAIGVLLLITNWFFHRVYWTDWMADLHGRKKTLLGSAVAGQMLGFVMLGFTSVYREGFETVLFLQALVLEAGAWTVLQGTALGMAGVLAVGWVTFKLQSRLPYKRMLVVTGVLIGAVLLVMVGNTAHVMQVVGWLPIHPIRWLTFPYWSGLWFGLYPTWEGIGLQAAAALFVIGSYFLAERVQKRPAPHKNALPARIGVEEERGAAGEERLAPAEG
jgi:high-affinity iron transporter